MGPLKGLEILGRPSNNTLVTTHEERKYMDGNGEEQFYLRAIKFLKKVSIGKFRTIAPPSLGNPQCSSPI